MITIKLSVSSVILVSVLSGCSQQQAGNSPPLGSQQLAGSTQVAPPKKSSHKPTGLSINDFFESKTYRKERLALLKSGASQQQVDSAIPKVIPTKKLNKPKVATVKNVHKSKVVTVKKIIRKKPHPTRSVTNTQRLPAAKPGQCFAKAKLPAKYITKTKRVFIQRASTRRVLVRGPQYRWVNKKILVRKAGYKSRVRPALYNTVTQRKMVKPAYNTWRKGHGAITRIDNMTGEIMCRVKIPAVYKNVKKRVQIRPAQTIRTYIPAIYKTIKQKQRISSAIYKTVKKPAKYKTQRYRVKVRNVRYVWRSVLCRTNTLKQYHQKNRNISKANSTRHQNKKIVKRSLVRAKSANQYSNSGIHYQHYLKANNTGSAYFQIEDAKVQTKSTKSKATHFKSISKKEKKRILVYKIQKSLKTLGFDPGGLDGKMGAWTTAALKAFQRSRGLSVGVLDRRTFKALGLLSSKGAQLVTSL